MLLNVVPVDKKEELVSQQQAILFLCPECYPSGVLSSKLAMFFLFLVFVAFAEREGDKG